MIEFSQESVNFLRDAALNSPPDLASDLIETANKLEMQIHLFDDIMSENNGIPTGIELKKELDDKFVVILEDCLEIGSFRAIYFDPDGFIGHTVNSLCDDLLKEVISEGYTVQTAGVLDFLSKTDRWKKGMKKSSIRDAYNQGLIGFDLMLDQFKNIEEGMA